jgi:hypothetical protein
MTCLSNGLCQRGVIALCTAGVLDPEHKTMKFGFCLGLLFAYGASGCVYADAEKIEVARVSWLDADVSCLYRNSCI